MYLISAINMQAKYYIYRNLHTGGFSVRYKGRVIDRFTDVGNIVAENVTFKVNELGRNRVIYQRRKNVHAFAVCDKYKKDYTYDYDDSEVISYNPYKSSFFTYKNCSIFFSRRVMFRRGKCYKLDTQDHWNSGD